MSNYEFFLCSLSLLCSSTSQLFMKANAISSKRIKSLLLLAIAGALQITSIYLVLLALQTLPLSQLVTFAAASYVLTPMLSYFFFGESVNVFFWSGASFIIFGIYCVQH